MALKLIIKSLEEVSEALRSEYIKDGDSYVLDTDDTELKAKIAEFRNENITLRQKNELLGESEKELTELREKYEQYKDLDPVKAREAVEKMNAIEENQLIDAGKLDEVVEQRISRRVERMQSDYDGKITALQSALDKAQGNEKTYRGKLEEVVIDNALQTALTNAGAIRQGAMTDALSRGRNTWKLDTDGNPIPMNGSEVIYGKDGKQPISTEEWAQSLVVDAPWLFEGSTGGGAGGNTNSNLESGKISLTDQDSLNANIEAIAKGEVTVG